MFLGHALLLLGLTGELVETVSPRLIQPMSAMRLLALVCQTGPELRAKNENNPLFNHGSGCRACKVFYRDDGKRKNFCDLKKWLKKNHQRGRKLQQIIMWRSPKLELKGIRNFMLGWKWLLQSAVLMRRTLFLHFSSSRDERCMRSKFEAMSFRLLTFG